MYHVTNHFHHQGIGFHFLMLKSCSHLNIGTNEQIKIAPFFFFKGMVTKTLINFLQWFYLSLLHLVSVGLPMLPVPF